MGALRDGGAGEHAGPATSSNIWRMGTLSLLSTTWVDELPPEHTRVQALGYMCINSVQLPVGAPGQGHCGSPITHRPCHK